MDGLDSTGVNPVLDTCLAWGLNIVTVNELFKKMEGGAVMLTVYADDI